MNSIWKAIALDRAYNSTLNGLGLMRRDEAPGAGLFLLGLGVGLVGGAAVALLLTPYSGGEAREKLVQAGSGIGRTVTTKYSELTRQLQGNQSNGATASIGSSTMGATSYNGMTGGSF